MDGLTELLCLYNEKAGEDPSRKSMSNMIHEDTTLYPILHSYLNSEEDAASDDENDGGVPATSVSCAAAKSAAQPASSND